MPVCLVYIYAPRHNLLQFCEFLLIAGWSRIARETVDGDKLSAFAISFKVICAIIKVTHDLNLITPTF